MRVSLLLLAAACVAFAQGQYKYPFQDPALPMEERITNLLSLMTVEEKIACFGTRPNVPRLGVMGTGQVEGLHGLAMGGPGGWGRPKVVPTTQFPQAVGMAETWDTDAIRQAGAVEGYEVRYMAQHYQQGGLVVRAPNADLARDPRWGRTEESYGEDPFLNGTLAVAFIKGLQGNDPKYWQAASLMKHFLANSNENNRVGSSSNFDARLLREYYSVPFRMGVMEGGSRAYMAAYNAMNGIPCTMQPILRSITIDEWGQDGIICTDAGGLRFSVSNHKYYKTMNEAAAGAVKAGINQFLEPPGLFTSALAAAMSDKLLTEADLDRSLRGVFRVMIRLGMMDPPEMVPYSKIGKEGPDPWTTEKHKAVARLMTQKSIVLLKNEGGMLPLAKDKLKSVAVIGPYANTVALDWYSGTPPYTVSALDGIKAKVGPGVEVKFDAGANAAEAAKSADVAIVVVGNHPTCDDGWEKCPVLSDGKEAVDRRSINLQQEELVQTALAANPRTVMVLISSFPFAIGWSQAHVPAIVHMTHNSEELGNALADVLFGDYNPAGRLVATWPRSIDQVPPMMDYNIRHGRTYMYFKGEPLYAFGFGLSYSKFQYSNLRTDTDRLHADGRVTVSVDVANTGARAGDEVVELYVAHPKSKVERPVRELRGFQRVTLNAGEKRTVTIPVTASSLAYWDEDAGKWVVERERVEIQVGASSSDIRERKTIQITE
ncbi:MAG TPA: glycoside hydrolase family 3 C-terminal domain-containing protein [Bryobacteraceae bacterium]|nr:glycoside hydrolase family 3 C-terminal domain-containing protein [Bryobacteraceae bacterium]